jgi:hypothetical protein
MESPHYYACLENLNRGVFNNLEGLKEKALDIKEMEVAKETREERRARKKAQGEFDEDSDDEEEKKKKKKKKNHGGFNYMDNISEETKG